MAGRDCYAGTLEERKATVCHLYFLGFLDLANRIAVRKTAGRRRQSQEFLATAFKAGRELGTLVIQLGQADEAGEQERLDDLVSILAKLGVSLTD